MIQHFSPDSFTLTIRSGLRGAVGDPDFNLTPVVNYQVRLEYVERLAAYVPPETCKKGCAPRGRGCIR